MVPGWVVLIDVVSRVWRYPGGDLSPRGDICRDHQLVPAFSGRDEIRERSPAAEPALGEEQAVKGTMATRGACSPRLLGCFLGTINRAKARSDRNDNLVCAAGGFIKELNCGSLKTLKAISYRATRFLAFLIVIMIINVYKLQQHTGNAGPAGEAVRESRSSEVQLPFSLGDSFPLLLLK